MKLTDFELLKLKYKLGLKQGDEITPEKAVAEYKGFIQLILETGNILKSTSYSDSAFMFLTRQYTDADTIVKLLGKMLYPDFNNWGYQFSGVKAGNSEFKADICETFPCIEGYQHGTACWLFKPINESDFEQVDAFMREYGKTVERVPPEYFAILTTEVIFIEEIFHGDDKPDQKHYIESDDGDIREEVTDEWLRKNQPEEGGYLLITSIGQEYSKAAPDFFSNPIFNNQQP